MERSLVGGVAASATAAVAWGGMFPVAAQVMQGVDPLYMTAIRYGVAGLLFLGILAAVEGARALRPSGQAWRLFVYGSLGYAGFNFLAFTGQHRLGPSGVIVAPIVVATGPLLTALVLWAWQRVRPRAVTFVTMLAALGGVILAVTGGSLAGAAAALSNGSGTLLVLAGALCFVFYSLGGSRFPGWSPLRYAALTCLFGNITVWAIPVVGTAAHVVPAPTTAEVSAHAGGLLYLIVVAGLLGILTWNAGIARLGAANGVLFINLVPVVAMTVSAAQGEAPTAVQAAGAALTVAALVANNLLARVGCAAPRDGVSTREDALRAT